MGTSGSSPGVFFKKYHQAKHVNDSMGQTHINDVCCGYNFGWTKKIYLGAPMSSKKDCKKNCQCARRRINEFPPRGVEAG